VKCLLPADIGGDGGGSMSEMRAKPAATQAETPDDFDERVDRCLAMVLHYAEVQEIASIVKRVHADKSQEKTKCDQKP
jgi:hypothetical protein